MFAADCSFYSLESLNPQIFTEILAETLVRVQEIRLLKIVRSAYP